mmetsp:Transcript_31037/g.87188  ORF Transcript_31037/g.87188 Transcript_31037/m.87188 type:complete len:206 (+) Transcript_31037:566-1183(+)
MRSSSSPIPFSPMTYTLLPVSLNLVCSRYAAAAKDELKISSGWTSRPKDVNFDLYPALLLVELLVTKKSLVPAARKPESTLGMPEITLSPRQMTPSQSKMKTSTPARNFDGSVSRLACCMPAAALAKRRLLATGRDGLVTQGPTYVLRAEVPSPRGVTEKGAGRRARRTLPARPAKERAATDDMSAQRTVRCAPRLQRKGKRAST